MTGMAVVTLAALAVLCTGAYALDQDELRELATFSREDVHDAHALDEGEAPPAEPEEATSETDGWLGKQLRLFPESDLDGDGVLRQSEARAWYLRQIYPFASDGHELDMLPDGVSQWRVDLPMSTGGTLATEVYLPRGGGPWPVVLTRSGRGRMDSALDFGVPLLATGKFAYVGQDRSAPGEGRRGRDSRADGHDTIEWIGRQPWCNGKVGMFGYSEAGITSLNAYVTDPPHMELCMAAISCLTRDPRDRVTGSRRRRRREGWSPPDAITEPYHSPFEGLGEKIDIPLNNKTGWFDLFTQGAIDEWEEMRKNGKSILIVGTGAHGGHLGLAQAGGRLPPIYSDCDVLWDEMPAFRWLTDEVAPEEVRSIMYYFLMGDCLDPDAPGNVWKQTDSWPVPHEPTPFYLTGDGALRGEQPSQEGEDGSLSYTYDPSDPVEAIPCYNAGMRDQRPLAEREDILRFETEPLEEPLEITGRARLQLHVSSDAPDTMFTASVVDLYPDGYEAILLEDAAMARFHSGFQDPQPMEEDKVYELEIEFISTAYVFAPGHRVRLHVSSSAAGRFDVHPNTWEGVESYDEAQVAHNTVHVSAAHPSRLVLPVVEPGVSVDYVATPRPEPESRAVAEAAPAKGLPQGWECRERTVEFATPEGDGEKALGFCLNNLEMTGTGKERMELVRIPAGRVEVGEPESEEHRVVELDGPVYMSACEVTEAQYAEVMDENPSRFLGPNLPVQCVSWEDAEEFCRRLSERDGVRYRLPTGEEWEYACRAGSTTRFWWGPQARHDTAWWGPHMGGRPSPVGRKLANRYGLFDMAGNVREWVRCAPDPESQGSMRDDYCLRGGPYYEGSWSLASDCRIDYPDRQDGYNQCGFRVVVDVE